jgi:deazaflavin-dependent oxidoreductase (nitroreductase family)
VPLPGWLARLNRRVTNPVLRPVAGRLPGFGVVLHRGRRSGRLYRTPVNVFQVGRRFLVVLTYGPNVDWVKNVLAAGGCQILHRGHRADLVRPELGQLRPAEAGIPAWVRGSLRILQVTEVLRLELGPRAGAFGRGRGG